MGPIGYSELIVLVIVAVILFGSKLPEVARTVGNSYAQFRKGLADLQSSFHVDDHDTVDSRLEYTPDDTSPEPNTPRFQPPPVTQTAEAESEPAADETVRD